MNRWYAFKREWVTRSHLVGRILRGESVAYRIRIENGTLYLDQPGMVVECVIQNTGVVGEP